MGEVCVGRKTRGEHRVMKLLKGYEAYEKGENYAVFYFAGKRIFLYIFVM